MPKKLDRYEFIWKAIQKQGYKDDFREVVYKGNKENVTIIDDKNVRFLITPNAYLKGIRPRISRKKRIGRPKYTFDEIKRIIIEKRGNVYDFGDGKINNKIPLSTIITFNCKKCGKPIKRAIKAHLNFGCPHCRLVSFHEFVDRATQIHGKKFTYNPETFSGMRNDTTITCPKHGDFVQKACYHLNGDGCPKCKQSKLEKEVEMTLTEHHIQFEYSKKYPWLRRQTLDFYIPDFNVAIECQGIQHFEPIEHFGGKEALCNYQERDALKNSLCESHNIRLLYYTNVPNVVNYPLGKLIYNKEELLEEIRKHGNQRGHTTDV